MPRRGIQGSLTGSVVPHASDAVQMRPLLAVVIASLSAYPCAVAGEEDHTSVEYCRDHAPGFVPCTPVGRRGAGLDPWLHADPRYRVQLQLFFETGNVQDVDDCPVGIIIKPTLSCAPPPEFR